MGLGVQQRWDSEHVSKKSCLIDIHNAEGEIYTKKLFSYNSFTINYYHTAHYVTKLYTSPKHWWITQSHSLEKRISAGFYSETLLGCAYQGQPREWSTGRAVLQVQGVRVLA